MLNMHSTEDLLYDRNVSKRTSLNYGEVPAKLFFIFVVFVELCIIILTGVLAYYLRFTDTFQIFHGNIKNCSEVTDFEPVHKDNYLYKVTDAVFYSLLILVPAAMILVGETLRTLVLEKTEKTLVMGDIRLPVIVRRLVRFYAIFLLGLFLTSITTDTLKCLTGRPRPHFCIQTTNGRNVTREDITSFPSFHSAISLYSAVFASLYVHFRFSLRGVYTLRPLLITALLTMAFLVCWQRFHINRNHWEDVLAGGIVGICFGLYQSVVAARCFKENPLFPMDFEGPSIKIPIVKCQIPRAQPGALSPHQAFNENVSSKKSDHSFPFYSAY